MNMYRLGVKQPDKIRPILLRMQTISDKAEMMSKLWMLKHARINLKKLSITNDYTLNERKIIKEYVEEAKKRNTTGANGYAWKVRGTPTNNLRLIKIKV